MREATWVHVCMHQCDVTCRDQNEWLLINVPNTYHMKLQTNTYSHLCIRWNIKYFEFRDEKQLTFRYPHATYVAAPQTEYIRICLSPPAWHRWQPSWRCGAPTSSDCALREDPQGHSFTTLQYLQDTTTRDNAMQRDARHKTMQCNAMHDTRQGNAMQCNAMPCNIIGQ